MKKLCIAAMLFCNVALAQKSKKTEEIRLPNIVVERAFPTKPSPSVYQTWEILAGVPDVKYFFIGSIEKGDCFEWFYLPVGTGYKIIGVRDLKTRIVYWKKEHLK